MGVLFVLDSIFQYCWRLWNIEFTVGPFTFTLWNVAIVSVGVWVASLIITAILEGD